LVLSGRFDSDKHVRNPALFGTKLEGGRSRQ
jgi:hypothetical protein